jgi:hypothetical protein
MATERKFDIFAVLDKLSRKQRSFIDDLTQDDLKAIPAVVVMRWMSGSNSKQQTYIINEIANPLVFSLYRHPRLLLQLLMVCAVPGAGRCSWIKQQKAPSSRPISVKVVMRYFDYSERRARECMALIPPMDIISMAEDLGYQPDDIKKIHLEHKDTAHASKSSATKAPAR